VAAIRKLNARYAGQAFPMRAAEKWNRLSRELDETEELITSSVPAASGIIAVLDDYPGARSWVFGLPRGPPDSRANLRKIRKCRFSAGESVSASLSGRLSAVRGREGQGVLEAALPYREARKWA
jgi:hypothetical protein